MVRPSSAPPGSAAPAMGLEAKPTPSVSRQWLATVLRRTSIWGVGSAWNLPPSRRRAALAARRPARRMASSRSCTSQSGEISPSAPLKKPATGVRSFSSVAQAFGVGEEGRDSAIALDAGSAAPIEAQFVGEAGMGLGVGDGVDDGAGDLRGEEIEKHGGEVRQGSGERVIDFGGSEVGGAVMGMGGGEDEFLGAEALAAIDASEHLGVQAGGDGEQLGGDEGEVMAEAVVEVEGTRVEAGPVPAGDASGGAVAAHGDAGGRSNFGFGGAGGEAVEGGRRRVEGIGGDGDTVSGTAGE